MISSQGYEIVPEWQDRRENGETCVEIAADVGEVRSYISRRTKPPAKSINRGGNSGHENSFDKHNYDDNRFKKPTAAACIPKPNFLLGQAGGFIGWKRDEEAIKNSKDDAHYYGREV